MDKNPAPIGFNEKYEPQPSKLKIKKLKHPLLFVAIIITSLLSVIFILSFLTAQNFSYVVIAWMLFIISAIGGLIFFYKTDEGATWKNVTLSFVAFAGGTALYPIVVILLSFLFF